MVSPVPKHLRTENEVRLVPRAYREHVSDLAVLPTSLPRPAGPSHRAKFVPGLTSALLDFAVGTVGDPMAGTGTAAWESHRFTAVNDIDQSMSPHLDPLRERGCVVTYDPTHKLDWERDTMIFSPPYYPRTDRTRPNAHDDNRRGPVVGFRDSYGCDHSDFIGNPGGVNAILTYRAAMTDVYDQLQRVAGRMIVVTKNWWRLGVELRLDLDTILMAMETGWVCTERHGWEPPPSLWSRYNQQRGGFRVVEDVLIFEKAT